MVRALIDGAPRATVVLFGDSLTQRGFADGGWAAAVADYLTRRADVYNRGYGGYNTRWARHPLEHIFPLEEEGAECARHLAVVVWFGANDAAAPTEKVHVPLAEYADNLRAIVRHLHRAARHVILVTPPPVHGPSRLAYQRRAYGDCATGTLERSTEVAGQYAAEVVRVGAELGAVVVDVHAAMLELGDGWADFVRGDGLHLEADGQRFVGAKLVDALRSALRLPFAPGASAQERLAADAPSLPVELPIAQRVDADDFAACMRDHQRQARRRQQLMETPMPWGLPGMPAESRR